MKHMTRLLLIFLLAFSYFQGRSQCSTCSATSFTIDLSAAVDTVYSIQSVRNGNCCTGTNCIKFNITLNPGSTYVNFSVLNPAPSGSAYYQIDCGPQTSIGTPACVSGQTSVCIVYCKPGNDNPTYIITASSALKASPDLTLRQGCTGTLSTNGLIATTIKWTSIFPGAQGAYNNYLSCTTGCSSTTVTPAVGAPPYIDYAVSGSDPCSGLGADTIRVYTVPPLDVALSPANPIICTGSGSSVTLSATPSGGKPPYVYSWNTGQSTSSFTTPYTGTYIVSISDSVQGCPAVSKGITILPVAPPPPPVVSSSAPVCPGDQINLYASAIAGATYYWTGPNGFTSNLQNPVIASASVLHAGTYTVVATVAGCSSAAASLTLVVNFPPAVSAATSNSPVCLGGTIVLTASSTPGATFTWTGPNNFVSNASSPTIANAAMVNAGMYNVVASLNGCLSGTTSVPVTINPPQTPVATNNSAICEGDSLKLFTTPVNGATQYNWTGPNGVTVSSQNPVLPNVTVANAGTYTVLPVIPGCTAFAASTMATIKATPAPPVLTSNSPVCIAATITLQASGTTGATYSWTGPSSFTSSNQNPSITNASIFHAGNYAVKATVNGCTGSVATIPVVVNVPPAVPTLTSNSPVCLGGIIQLSASSTPGATFSWTGPNNFTSSIANPIITNAAVANAGVYNVVASLNGCVSGTGSIAVGITPPQTPVATNSGALCEGDSLRLFTSTVTGATSYNWSGPNGYTASTQNPLLANVSTLAAGAYTVTPIIPGCTTIPASTTVVVKPTPVAPVVTSNSPVCLAATINLQVTAATNATYTWTGPSSFTSSNQNPSITNASVLQAGTYTVKATVNGCVSAASTVPVVVNVPPAVPVVTSNSPVCLGGIIQLAATSTTGATFSWTGPNNFTSSVASPSINNAAVVNAGVYNVVASLNSCVSGTGSIAVGITPPQTPVATNNGALCAGDSLKLFTSTVTGATLYNWSGPNGYYASTQNPLLANVSTLAAGTYTVTPIIPGCTTIPASTTVIVKPTAVAPVVTSNSPVCLAATINLQVTAATNATYTWTGPSSFTSSNQNPSITNASVLQAGTYTVKATVNGCVSAASTVPVVVNVPPAVPVVTSNSPVCLGGVIQLSATSTTGATFSWTGPNNFASSIARPSINNAALVNAGVYNVVASLNGCVSGTGSIAVGITPPQTPAATNNGALCEGDSLKLFTSSVTGATLYNWIGPNGYNANTQTPILTNVTTLASGTYTVTPVIPGCTTIPASTTVVVKPTPTAPVVSGNSPVCLGGTISLEAIAAPGASYNWTGPNSFSSSNQNPSISNASVTNAGTYSAKVTMNGCVSVASTIAVVVNVPPAVPTLTTNSPVCLGGTIQLAATSTTGATFSWTGPNNFTSSSANPSITNAALIHGGVYSAIASLNGCVSGTASIAVGITPPQTPVATNNGALCEGDSLKLFASTITGATSYNWSGPNGYNATTQNPTLPKVTTLASGTYTVTPVVPGCTTLPASTTVVVKPTPTTPVASNTSPVCAGGTIVLQAAGPLGATYSWAGPNNFSSVNQNPAITSASSSEAGIYIVKAIVNGCSSLPATTNVIVNPIPAAPVVSSNSPLCEGSTINLSASTVANGSFQWTGPNGFASNIQNPSIANSSINNSGAYSATVTVLGCTSASASTTVQVNSKPLAAVVSSNSPVCEAANIQLNAASVSGATYSWAGPNGFTSSMQNPVIPNAANVHAGSYTATVTVNGCSSPTASAVTVVIRPTPIAPVITSNGPVCEGSSLNLSATTISGPAAITWTGPAGFNSSLISAIIQNTTSANSGIYTAVATVNGCTSTPTTSNVIVNQKAVVNAGTNQVVCPTVPVALYGNVSGGTSTGIWSSTTNGTFSSSNTALNGSYHLSAADLATGSVNLRLTSTSNGACPSVSQTIMLNITPAPIANPGSDQVVCYGNATVHLNGSVSRASSSVWKSSGSGTFLPSDTAMNAIYLPSQSDKDFGRVSITLRAMSTGSCAPTDSTITVTILPGPRVNAGPDRYVLANNSVVLNPTYTGAGLQYLWTPNFYLNSDTIATPLCTPLRDQQYVIKVTDQRGCSATDTMFVKVLLPLQIPNVFSPNNDGTNDKWIIANLEKYPDATVHIFNRYGQKVFQSLQYSNPWDGTYNGNPLPVATYYYIIDPKNGVTPIAGYVAILR
jgi:gliding motility-associated-like protein